MNNQNRKPLIGVIALTAALAMPLAFAQSPTEDSAATQAQSQVDETTQDATTQDAATQDATGSAQQSATQSSGSAGQQGWADLDTDGDGMISKQESAANAGLSQIFDQADGDADGSLTQDEYKSFVEKSYGEPKPQQ
ncbi:MAG TPA: EF-hand domain-containing protein [Pseudoxanthomonas sp.]|nr:EF-hand domain-containing protein [Pseudoxanthomonas sp.]